MTYLRTCSKAIVAGASTAIAAAIPIASGGLSLTDCLIVAGAFLAGAFPTWLVKNPDGDDV